MSSPSEQLVAESGLPPELSVDLEPALSALREFVPDEPPPRPRPSPR